MANKSHISIHLIFTHSFTLPHHITILILILLCFVTELFKPQTQLVKKTAATPKATEEKVDTGKDNADITDVEAEGDGK